METGYLSFQWDNIFWLFSENDCNEKKLKRGTSILIFFNEKFPIGVRCKKLTKIWLIFIGGDGGEKNSNDREPLKIFSATISDCF